MKAILSISYSWTILNERGEYAGTSQVEIWCGEVDSEDLYSPLYKVLPVTPPDLVFDDGYHVHDWPAALAAGIDDVFYQLVYTPKKEQPGFYFLITARPII